MHIHLALSNTIFGKMTTIKLFFTISIQVNLGQHLPLSITVNNND